jgi:hypothetical protein
MEDRTINDENEIIRLFVDLIKERAPFFLRYGLKEYSTIVTARKRDDLHILAGYAIDPGIQYVSFHFFKDDLIHFGQLRLKDTNKFNEIISELPKLIYTRKERKFERVPANNQVFCQFNIISLQGQEKTIDTPSSAPYFLRGLFYELQKEIPDVKKIFKKISDELSNMANASNIRFYKKDEKLGEIEKLIIKNKKALFIPDTRDVQNYVIAHETPFYVSLGKFFQGKITNEKWDQVKVNKAATAIMLQDKKLKRLSYIYVPIFLFGEVTGHLYAATSYEAETIFSQRDITFMKSFADILSEGLTKSRLFKEDGKEESKNFVVEDVSRGGVMLKVFDPYMLKFIKEETKMSIKLDIMGKEVKAIGKVVRLINDKDHINLGIKFTELSPKDDAVIKKYIDHVTLSEH